MELAFISLLWDALGGLNPWIVLRRYLCQWKSRLLMCKFWLVRLQVCSSCSTSPLTG